jgi:putative intracellular protease/amidase
MRLVLINAERIKDKNLTSYKSIRLDLENQERTGWMKLYIDVTQEAGY